MLTRGFATPICCGIGVMFFLLGCGSSNPRPAQLTGTVKYKGQLVKGGTVVVYTKESGAMPIPIRSDGTYLGTDLPVGEAAVTIETESVNPGKTAPQYGQGGKREKGYVPPGSTPRDKAAAADAYVKIPAKYGDAKTSGLSVTLGSGSNTKDFDLTD